MACGPKKSLWFLGGHLEAGIYANEYGMTDVHGKNYIIPPGETYHPGSGLYQPGNSNFLHNARQADFQMNQLYLNFGKKLSKRGFDVGGQIDFMYGTDARFVQSQNLEYKGRKYGWPPSQELVDGWRSGDYYSALPQMFFEVGYNKWSVKAGKFLNPMGHNSVISTDRFFYTLSDSFALTPVTQSGVLATWEGSKRFTAFGGWTCGYKSDLGSTLGWSRSSYLDSTDLFFDTSDNNAFLGGIEYKLNDRVKVKYAVMLGRDTSAPKDNSIGKGTTQNDRDYFVQSLVVDVKLNRKWDYTFEWTLRNEENEGVYNDREDIFYWGGYGINQELIYKFNKKWSIGARAEWIHVYHNNYFWNNANPQENINYGYGINKYSFVLGANWSPFTWITIRPELRYDKFDGPRSDFFVQDMSDQSRVKYINKQLSGGVSVIVKF